MKWHFNLALGPWQGGRVERLVRRVKELLKKHYKTTPDKLLTVLLETELIINNCPLAHIYTNSMELRLTLNQLALTLNQLEKFELYQFIRITSKRRNRCL